MGVKASNSIDIRFKQYLERGFSLSNPLDMLQALHLLRSLSPNEKREAAHILFMRFKKSVAMLNDTQKMLDYFLHNMSFIAVAADACPGKNGDVFLSPMDTMCGTLLHDSNLVTTLVRDLALSEHARMYISMGFHTMIEAGNPEGYWFDRRRREGSQLSNLSIILLSEIILSNGKTGPYFKSLRGSQWFSSRTRHHGGSCMDPFLILKTTFGVIKNRRNCTVNYGDYLIALVDLAAAWARVKTEPSMLQNVLYSERQRLLSKVNLLKEVLVRLFCEKDVKTVLHNLSENEFQRVPAAAFRHCCTAMTEPLILRDSTRLVAEFITEIQDSYHKCGSSDSDSPLATPRCRRIILGLFDLALEQLFPVASFAPEEFWGLVSSLHKSVQLEFRSLFQVSLLSTV